MSDQWEYFFCAIENAPASVFVDIGIHDAVPDRARPHLVVVTAILQEPNEQGMTTDEEAERLWKIEEWLVKLLAEAAGGTFVGRVTSEGTRAFYFYVSNPEPVPDKVDHAFDQLPGYDYHVELDDDPEWEAYVDTLYPAPIDWQQIFDRQLVEQLIEAGDPLTVPREVAHYLYFNSPDGRDEFEGVVSPLGFQIADKAEQPDEEHPHALRITRQDPVVMDHIHNVTRDLLSHAAPLGGIYDGWECELMGPEML